MKFEPPPKERQSQNQNDLCLHELFEQQVRQTPQATAVVFEHTALTYQELNQQATELASRLQQRGVGPEVLVGLCVERSLEMIVGLLGILKAGGAFVPLDPTYPQERLAFMVADSRVPLVLTATAWSKSLPLDQTPILELAERVPAGVSETDLVRLVKPHNLACCLYTSGSTGQPKGVLIEHHSLTTNCYRAQTCYQMGITDRVLLFASLNYIAALEQIFTPLTVGATLVLREPELWNAMTFPAKVTAYGLTVVDLSPGYWHTLLESWQTSPQLVAGLPLRLVILGGEALRPETVKLWQQSPLKSVRFLNAYGMTETPVTATFFEIPTEGELEGEFERVPIGQPVPNRTVTILDKQLQPVPPGTVGELCIGGVGLARGYLNQPTLTAEKFIPNPFGEGRLYRTGDLGRWLPDGVLEYLGRQDHQVQLRGFRVELGEIEATLKAHATVKEAVVMAQGEGTEKRLVVYVVPQLTTSGPDIWQTQGSYRHEEGILTNPMERLAFKLQQHNIQSYQGATIALTKPNLDETRRQTYLMRQSYRQFVPEIIPFEPFCQFLSCLLQLNLPDLPIPKYRYASALGLYPVQTYLYVKPNRIEGVGEGFYYYQPTEHRLILLKEGIQLSDEVHGGYNQPITNQAAFTLFLIAHLEAITPLYGRQLAEKFCWFEAGYMGQLLMTEAPVYQMGLCPLGDLVEFERSDEVCNELGLTENQRVVHTFLGGRITPIQMKTWLQPATQQPPSPVELKAEWQTYLQEKLPSQMVPEQFILLEQLPLTPNGKIDRQALSALQVRPTGQAKERVMPRTPTEQQLAQLWQELFKLPHIGVEEEFFELGGNSLLALQLLTKIQQTFAVELPLRVILEHNTIAQLADVLENQSASQTNLTTALSVEVLQQFAVLNLETVPPYQSTPQPPKAILLTGATGFVGAFLLHHLLTTVPETEVYCLVRSDSVTQARQRLLDTQQRYGLSLNESAQQRLQALSGDVSQSLLGLDGNQFSQLAQHIDCVYHVAANVNLWYSYKTLQAANVKGTQEVIDFATTQKSKPIHYISSTAIFEAKGFVAQPEPIGENVALEQCETVYGGYAQSKWVAENILQQAKAKGLPVNIYRLGMITGHSKTGYANTEDLLCRLFKLFIQQGQIPQSSAMIDMIPVDYAVQAITHLSQQTQLFNRHFHVTNQGSLSFQELAKTLNDMGYAVQTVDYQQWLEQLKTIAIDAPNNALGALLPLFTEEVDGKTYLEFSSLSLSIRDDNTQQGLQNSQLSCPPVNIDLLKIYFAYFVRQGFLTDTDFFK